MSRADQLVNAAVAMAVKAHVEGTRNVTDRSAFANGVGRRLQGTFGAELRRTADAEPAMTADDLFWLVIAPVEFKWMTVDNPISEALVASGARDRARQRNYGAPVDLDVPIPQILGDRIAELKVLVKQGADELKNRDRQPPPPTEPEFLVVPPAVRAALNEGIANGAAERKRRKDRAKESA